MEDYNDDPLDCVTDDDGHPYFEGPEKLLEVWFKGGSASASGADGRWGLRSVERRVWEEMLDLVHCQILNSVSNDLLDSFVLRSPFLSFFFFFFLSKKLPFISLDIHLFHFLIYSFIPLYLSSFFFHS